MIGLLLLTGCDRALPGTPITDWSASGPSPAELTPPAEIPPLEFVAIERPIVRTDATSQVLWLRARVSPAELRDPVVLLPRAYVLPSVWVEGERVVDGGTYREASGVPFYVAPLPRVDHDVTVVVRVASRYTQVGLPEGALVGDRSALLAALVRRDVPRTGLAIATLAIGLGALAFALRGRQQRALLGIALFSLGISGWSLFQTRTRQLWLPELPLWFGIWWVAPSVTSLGAAAFIEAVFGHGPRKLVRGIGWFFAVHIVLCLASLALSEEAFFAAAPVVFLSGRAAMIGGSIAIVVWTARSARAGDPAARRFLAGFAVAFFGVLHDVLVSFGVIRGTVLLADVGYLGMQLSWIAIVVFRLEQLERAVVDQAATLSRFVGERDALVRDLHDGLGGVVTNVRLLAERARSGDETQRQELVAAIVGLADEGLDELRLLMSGFDALPTTWRAAAAELRRAAATTLEPHGIEQRFESELGPGAPDLATFVTLVRIQREALTNVVKHAGARTVRLRLEVTEGALRFTIEDDGTGPSGSAPAPGHGRGLGSMRARAEALGATLTFAREGTVTRLVLSRSR